MRTPRTVVYAVCAACLLSPNVQAQAPILTAGATIATATGTSAMTSGDVDFDGHLDLVVANANDGTISIFCGDGAGGFPSREDIPTGAHPKAVAVGDLDGDGLPDVAAANDGDHTVTILLGRKGGRPRFVRTLGVGSEIRGLTFRPEGARNDLLVMRDQAVEVFATHGRRGVPILRGEFPFGAGFGEVLPGDFDGDGRMDLIGVGSVTVALMRGRGDGGFEPHVDLFEQDHASEFLQFWWAAAGELNGDGIDDLVAATYHWSSAYVDVGVWASGATPGTRIVSPDLGLPVAVGDIDGDGHADMIAVKSRSQGFSLFRGDGAGQLVLDSEYSAGSQTFDARIGDFDEDGRPDVAVLNYGSSTISIFINSEPQGGPSRVAAQQLVPAGSSRPSLELVAAPNPMWQKCRIRFDLPAAADVDLSVFDMAGRRVASLASGRREAGGHVVEWQHRSAGVYFVRLSAAGRSIARPLVVRP